MKTTKPNSVIFMTGAHGVDCFELTPVILKCGDPGIKMRITFMLKDLRNPGQFFERFTETFLNDKTAMEVRDILDNDERLNLSLGTVNGTLEFSPTIIKEVDGSLPAMRIMIMCPPTTPGMSPYKAFTFLNNGTANAIANFIHNWLQQKGFIETEESLYDQLQDMEAEMAKLRSMVNEPMEMTV